MKSCNVICNEIRFWVNEYYKLNQGGSIEELLNIQDQIAIRSMTLAEYVSSYKVSYNGSYFIRQIGVAKSSLHHQKNGMKIGTADKQALIDNEKNYEVEQANEATAVTLDLLLRQTNVILGTMAQRISYYKQEKQSSNRQV